MWLNVCWAPIFSTAKIFSHYIISVFEAVRVYTPSIKMWFITCRGKSVNLQGSLEVLHIVLRMDISLHLVAGGFLKSHSSAEFKKNLCHGKYQNPIYVSFLFVDKYLWAIHELTFVYCQNNLAIMALLNRTFFVSKKCGFAWFVSKHCSITFSPFSFDGTTSCR
jgi:hypothetical protein